tara:strand:+ start:438 stop:662 length:225 start_codon:yes stop_codon:yes gene_type:complete
MKLKEMLLNELFWLIAMWFCGFVLGLSSTMVPGQAETQKRHDTQVSKCLTVAQKWCPADDKREQRFEWCMKQWK